MSWVYDPDEASAGGAEAAGAAAAAVPAAVDVSDATGPVVQKGVTLVKLRGAESIEKQIAAVQQRLDHYQDRFDRAQANGDQAAVAAAEAKLKEKNGMIAALRSKLEALVVVSPKTGAVTLAVAVGDKVADGAQIARVKGNPILEAEFPATVGGSYAVGDQVTISAAGDEGRTERCQVSRVTADAVAVACAGALPAGPVMLPEPEL